MKKCPVRGSLVLVNWKKVYLPRGMKPVGAMRSSPSQRKKYGGPAEYGIVVGVDAEERANVYVNFGKRGVISVPCSALISQKQPKPGDGKR